MRKLLLPIALISLSIISCGGSKKVKTSEDIVVADLKNACDCLGAMDLLGVELLAMMEKYENREEMLKNADAKVKYDKNEAKLKEVEVRCQKDLAIKKEDAEKCDNYQTTKATMDKVKEKL